MVDPCEARGLYLACPGDSGEETFPEGPGTRREASCREVVGLVNQLKEKFIHTRSYVIGKKVWYLKTMKMFGVTQL